MKSRICICGGGSQGHVISAYLASKAGYEVNLLTTKPKKWQQKVIIEDCLGKQIQGRIHKISDSPEEVIPGCKYILLCLPGYAIEETLEKIRCNLDKDAIVGSVVSSTGFFFMAHKILPEGTPLFGFQRTPFISRIVEYGISASLLGYKSSLCIATLNVKNRISLAEELQKMFDTPVLLLNHFLEATLTNSNPLLHPARLYTLLKGWEPGKSYDYIPGFYSEWDDETSQILIDCDKEFHVILGKLPVDIHNMPTILEYYESSDAVSLTRKIRSIVAFKEIKMAMVKVDDGYIPELGNRYFTEDFPFGLILIKSVADVLEVDTPVINKILRWGEHILHTTYLGMDDRLLRERMKNTAYVEPEIWKNIISM